MNKLLLSALLALAPITLAPLPVSAQSATVQADNRDRLYDTLMNGVDQEQVLDGLVSAVAQQMVVSNPDAAALEATNPGFVAEMMTVLKPVVRTYRTRVMRMYRPRMVEELRNLFNDAEAGELADFYSSGPGRRLMQAVSGNVSSTNSIDAALAEEEISTEMLARDDAATVANSISSLSQEEIMQIAVALMRIPAAQRLPLFQQRSLPIRQAMEAEPPTADEMAEIQRVAIQAFEKYQNRRD